ncbi:hypothetical protein [Nocardia sp. SC052]|uniref:VG15 protein n=1 Tax=Nocardia sichangensis TaxID=3385975 RepID=UPI0039A25E5E
MLSAALRLLHRALGAALGRIILRRMRADGVPVTPEQRQQMARRLHREVVARRQRSYGQAVEEIRRFDRDIRIAEPNPYPVEAVVAALERAVEPPPPRPAAQPQPDQRTADSNHSESPNSPESPDSSPRASRARVTAPEVAPRPSARVAAPAELDPTSRRRARARVTAPTLENRTDPTVVREVAERLSATLTRHVAQAGREAVVNTALGADEEIGWARVLSGAENCAFCAMLASRGPVYRSDKSALTVVGRGRNNRTRGTRALGESYHDNCDCEAVLVRRGQDWEGREEFERLERLWMAASALARGDEPRLLFNRAWRRSRRDPEILAQLDRLWADSTEGLVGSDANRAFTRAVRDAQADGTFDATDRRRTGAGPAAPERVRASRADQGSENSEQRPTPPLPRRRPSGDVRVPESLESAASPQEVGAYLQARYGVMAVGFSDPALPMEQLREFAGAFDDVAARYPDIEMPRVVGISDDEQDHAYANTTSIMNPDGTLTCTSLMFSREYMLDPARMQAEAERDVAVGFHPRGMEQRAVYAVTVHELGHVLDIQGDDHASANAVEELERHFMANVTSSADRAELAAQYREWIGELSGYSRRGDVSLNREEAVAEAFVDVEMNGDAAPEAAHVLHRLLVESRRRI